MSHPAVMDGTSPGTPWRVAATCARGLEGVVAAELVGLGMGPVVPGVGVVEFEADLSGVIRTNLWLRGAMRVVVKLAEGRVDGRQDLYDMARRIPWEAWMGVDQTLAVDVAGRSPSFTNTAFAGLVVKDAVVDRLRDKVGSRPNVNRFDPDLRMHVHLGTGRAGIGVDSSGAPLSHRGYRPRGGPAPLAESLAAGVLLLAGYDGTQPLLDPMCGTGTLAIEGALLATARAPGLRRSFAWERWKFLPGDLGRSLRAEAESRRKSPAWPVVGRDLDPRAVAAATANARAAGVGEYCRFERGDVRTLPPVQPGSLIVSNPPYGHRLGDEGDLTGLYREMGRALKAGAPGSKAWLLVGDRTLGRALGLRPQHRIELFNGPLRCVLLGFELVRGQVPAPGFPPEVNRPSRRP